MIKLIEGEIDQNTIPSAIDVLSNENRGVSAVDLVSAIEMAPISNSSLC
jgi:hypothetical protein